MARSREPALWSLFSAGGMVTALVFPALVAVLWIAPALDWIPELSFERAARLAGHPAARAALFVTLTLAFFHWAHRFRYTLYDGLQLYHLNRLIAVLTYGAAGVLTLGAAAVTLVLL